MLKNSIKAFILFLFCSMTLCQVSAESGESSSRSDPGQIKLDKMRKLQAASSNGVILFNAKTYK